MHAGRMRWVVARAADVRPALVAGLLLCATASGAYAQSRGALESLLRVLIVHAGF